ncbi:MAG: aminopeptidase, partial [Acidimicrobiia bacterium]|nr:aminopeptidase [Acidimicrobiia bacterium]
MYTKLRLSLGAALMLCLAVVVIPMSADAASKSCDTRVNNTVAKLVECVTLEGVREHQAAFQAAADANGGIRAAGTPGYDATVDYVVGVLEGSGYDV